jgi:hypothetical protein
MRQLTLCMREDSSTAARASHRDGSFIRILRIERITQIAPIGDKAPNTGAKIFCSLPLGTYQSSHGALLRNNKKENPSNPANPIHPDETSVSVVRGNGEHK